MNKSIIEKLGINMPFNGDEGCYLYVEKGPDKIIVNMETNKLLWSSPEMLAILINDLIRSESDGWCENCCNHEHSDNCIKLLAVEKAIDKKWPEIKEIIK